MWLYPLSCGGFGSYRRLTSFELPFAVQRKSSPGTLRGTFKTKSSTTQLTSRAGGARCGSLWSDRIRAEKATRTLAERICIEIFLLSCLYNLV